MSSTPETGALDGTVALVTGASSGIGEATARTFARLGATVALVARRQERLDALAAEISGKGGKALALTFDITRSDDAAAAVERTVAELGRLDTLVNNAGVMLLGPARDAPLEEWERMVDLNLKALLRVTHAALPHLLAAVDDSPRGVADIVNVSSVAGRVARAGSGVYNLTKWGVGAFSESLRQEFTTEYLRTSVIEPGAVATELRDHLRPEVREAQEARFAGVTPLEADDIAEAAAYIVTRRRDVAINEILIRPTGQAG